MVLCHGEGAVQLKIFSSSAEFREWLEMNHDRVPELWLGFYNKRTDKKVLHTMRRWTRLCVSDGSMECARASTRPLTNSASLPESRRATGAQSRSSGWVS